MAVNGQLYDHEDCRIEMPGGEAFGLTELNYEDGQEIEVRYGKGAVGRGFGRKNYEASGDMTLDRDQFEVLKKELKSSAGQGGFYDHAPFTIVSSYGNDGLATVTDTMQQVKITKISTSHKQGEANDSQMKLDFVCIKPILWNGVPAKKG
jgi:hypothetical protein